MTLRLKANAPVVPRWAVPRPALEKLLDGALEGRLTTVVAGPGFGKTTLLAAWEEKQPCGCWYSLGREDRALATPWGAETRSSCRGGEFVLVDDAAEQVASRDLRSHRRRRRAYG